MFLDVPTCSEEKLHSYISSIELRVDAWAIAVSNGDSKSPIDGPPTRDLIASVNVAKVDDPFTLVRELNGEVFLQLVWEVQLDLGRPRFRSLHQTVAFSPIATILLTDGKTNNNDFLEPFTALESNVLDPLDGLSGINEYPYLPVSRLEGYQPPATKKNHKIRIKQISSDPLPAYTVVVPRLKYSKINTSMPHPSTIASLDIDMGPTIDVTGVIENIEVSIAHGTIVPLTPDLLPVFWKSKDCLSFLYDLRPVSSHTESAATTSLTSSNANIDTLSIAILIKVNISRSSTATIKLSWTANVDFSLALNPSFGAPSQTLQRTNRPSSLSFGQYANSPKSLKDPQKSTTTLSSNRTASTNLQHHVIPTSISASESSAVLITLIAPTEPVRTAMPFSWKVLVINDSLKPAKLAIIPLTKIQRPTNATQQFAKRHAPKASNASLSSINKVNNQLSIGHTRNAFSTAKAVVDEQILYALHHQSISTAPIDTELVSLTAELRVGPLGAGQCHETEIRFIAYKSGIFSVDAVRIVDLMKEADGSLGMISDIRDLPEVVVANTIP